MSAFTGIAKALMAESAQMDVCAVGRFNYSSELDDDDRASLKGLFTSNVSTYKIHDLLRSHGVNVARDTVQRHRDGRCRCFETQ